MTATNNPEQQQKYDSQTGQAKLSKTPEQQQGRNYTDGI